MLVSENSFSVRRRKIMPILSVLVFAVLGYVLFYVFLYVALFFAAFRINYTVMLIIAAMAPLSVILVISGALYSVLRVIFWKITVDGDLIHYNAVFIRKTFTFHDIKRVSVKKNETSFYSESKRLFSIMTKDPGYEQFINCFYAKSNVLVHHIN